MGMRYRTVTKVGKGKYITGNYSFGTYLWSKFLYWILIFPYIIIFKYCFYVPIKWCIKKIESYFKNKSNNSKTLL